MSQTSHAGSNRTPKQSTIVVSGIVCTIAIFVIIVLTQKISGFDVRKFFEIKTADAMPPPPPPPVEPPKPPENREPEKKPELNKEPPKLNLTQLEAALNPGIGAAVGDYGLDLQGLAASDLDRVFDLAEVDQVPQPISRVSPTYPYEMNRARIQGTVRMAFICDKDGRVQDARVISSTRYEFERPALDALRRWRFEPGVKNGQKVPVRMEIPMEFAIKD